MDTSINHLQKIISSVAKALTDFNLKFTDISAVFGNSFTLFKVKPASGTKVSSFRKMEDDIAMSLGAQIRITAMPDCIGIEVPRKNRTPVLLHDCIGDETWYTEQKYSLPVILGDDVNNRLHVVDLVTLPHLLVAGATKQGKTAFLRTLMMSLIFKKKPEDLKFILLDPKCTEFKPLEILKNNYLVAIPDGEPDSGEETCIATDITQSERTLSALCLEQEKRYELLQKADTREIKSYNDKLKNGKNTLDDGYYHLPYIVCICDEYADLLMGADKARKKSIQASIISLAQKGRAVGIHLVISTQRPSTDVITGLIKANFPARAAFRVASSVDSTVILDCPGAEKLSGSGDMLFSTGLDCERIQVPYYSQEEMEDEISKLARDENGDAPYYLPCVGYVRADRLMDPGSQWHHWSRPKHRFVLKKSSNDE